MIQLFYGAKMMHQYLTSIVFCHYFLFHLSKRNIQNILFFFFSFLNVQKILFFSNVQYYCKHHLFGSARSIILFFLYKQLPKPFKGPLYHPCSEFIITILQLSFDLPSMTPGESHNEWYHYYCSNFCPFKRLIQMSLEHPHPPNYNQPQIQYQRDYILQILHRGSMISGHWFTVSMYSALQWCHI